MDHFLTHESPGKVVSLLGASMVSMLFLFMVTISNASFQQAQVLPDPFASSHVVAMVDIASNSYSNFINQNLIAPAGRDYGFVGDDVAFIADNAGPQIMQLAGLQNLGAARMAYAERPQVAGAYTQSPAYQSHSQGVFSLFFGN
ncbi:MAG: hypothetical protein P4L74_00115 [Candidatus Doudnabacteria bacterium]|nr:hypothetical protein [Candidatus Doudnabacteria bacterium]